MLVGIMLVLGFGHANTEGADRVERVGWGPKPLKPVQTITQIL